MNELLVAAEILEKAAAYIEAVEQEKDSALQSARSKVAAELKTRYTEATGEQLSDDVVSKLASTEPDIVALIEKLAGTAQAAISMGGPSEQLDADRVLTKKEAVAAAEDRLAAWLAS